MNLSEHYILIEENKNVIIKAFEDKVINFNKDGLF
jgi:hypothetical protein